MDFELWALQAVGTRGTTALDFLASEGGRSPAHQASPDSCYYPEVSLQRLRSVNQAEVLRYSSAFADGGHRIRVDSSRDPAGRINRESHLEAVFEGMGEA